MSENAVFTEVLELTIGSDQFAADLAKIEAQYTAAMARMDAASAKVGNIGGDSGADDLARQLNNLNESVDAGVGYWSRFGNALERASVRLPAMLIVATAMAAAFETVKAPVDALADGFRNLEESAEGTSFRTVAEDIDKLKTHFESVAATPIFDFASQELSGLKTWLTENRNYVDQLALAFGEMIADFLKQLASLGSALSDAGVFGTLAKAAAAIGYALGSGVISLRAMIQLAQQGAQTFAAMGESILHPGDRDSWNTDISGIGQRVDEIIRKHDEDQHQLTQLTENLYDAIDGKRNAKIPNTPEKSTDTLADVKSKFAEEVAAVKDAAEQKAEAIQRAIHKQELSHSEAAPKIHAIIDAEKKAIDGLISKYDALAASAIRASGTGTLQEQDAKISQTRTGFAKVATNFDRAGSKQETSADDAASDEQRKIKDDDLKASLELLKTKNAALTQAQGDYYKEGLETLRQFIAQKRDAENQEYQQEKALIESRMASVGKETEAYAKLANELAALNQGHTIKTGQFTREDDEAARLAPIQAEQQSIALAKSVLSQSQLTEKASAEAGHRERALEAQQKILAAQTALVERELVLAEAELQRLGYANKNTEQYEKQLVVVQNLKNSLGSAISDQIKNAGAKAAEEHPLYPNTAATETERSTADDNKAAADATLLLAQRSGASAAQLQVLADAAAAAAKAQQDAYNNTNEFISVMKDASKGIGQLESGVSSYLSGQSGGKGVIGGLGATLSNSSITGDGGLLQNLAGGPDSALGQAIPVIGPLIGGMFSTITALFQAGIERMVKAINDQISSIQTAASSGQIGLGQEITELQQAKQTAIDELGGSKKKGAQQQLNTILQSLNAQIGQLMFQQEQIITNFNNIATAGGLDTLSGTFASWYQTWDAINQQVKAYVDAGGSIATANQYLNQQLAIQRQTLTDQLNQGDQTALNDAIQLNQLLTQRSQLMKQEAETEFGLINADSEERRVSSAVQIGSQLEQQRYQYSQQLLQMDTQITLDQERLTVEGQIFDVNKNLADLQAASNALTIESLNEQLQKYKDMQAILQSTAGLTFGGPISNVPTANLPIPGEPTVTGATSPMTVTNNIIVNGDVTETNAATLGSEIARNLRSGRSNFAVTAQ